jgi:type VI secretion system protein ImpJ
VELSREVFPPCLTVTAHPGLKREVDYVADGLLAKGRILASHRRDRGIGYTQHGAADLLLLTLLSVCARWAPVLRHQLAGGAHPFQAYGTLLQVLGELAVLPDDEAVFPYLGYDHADPARCFVAARREIQSFLSRLLPSDFKEIPLVQAGDYYSSELEPAVFEDGAQYLLGVRADCSAEEARTMAVTAKVSSKRLLENLRRGALRGVPLSRLDAPPAEVPRRPGHHYFELGRHHGEWESVRRDLSIGVFLGTPPPAAEVSLLVVQRRK